MADWIFLAGNGEVIERLEQQVYTPGTSKSADFELYVFPSNLFYLARKNQDLREFLIRFPTMARDQAWSNLLAINFYLDQSQLVRAQFLIITEPALKDARISEIVESFCK